MPNLKSQEGAEMIPAHPSPTKGGVYSLTGNSPLANFEQEIANSSPCMTQTLLSNPGEVKAGRSQEKARLRRASREVEKAASRNHLWNQRAKDQRKVMLGVRIRFGCMQ